MIEVIRPKSVMGFFFFGLVLSLMVVKCIKCI